jgi:glycine/D-amino acid oxidase-like deaminating enzyme
MDTANTLPSITEWRSREDLESYDFPKDVLGALRLHSGCMVLHMPSYLGGLWEAIQTIGNGPKTWICIESEPSEDWHNLLGNFDAVVLSAGSGLFQDSIVSQNLPMQLVRGQSVEMKYARRSNHAVLGGKYLSPLPDQDRVLIGATHEYTGVPLDPDQVVAELRRRTSSFASEIWENGTVDRFTCGYRVQSNRGRHGRMPMVGKIDSPFHNNAWIYTGLSSRGLLYHGIFGEILANKMLQTACEYNTVDLDWWKQ